MKRKDTIAKLIDTLLKENIISNSDKKDARCVLTWMSKGRKEALTVSKTVVKNLEKSGFVHDGKIVFNPKGEYSGVEFVLLLLGAQGYIKRTTEGS